MSSFKWEIDDATNVTVPVCHCGEVDLRDAKNRSGPRWDVEEPDENSLIESVTGGTVGEFATPEDSEPDNLLKSIISLNRSKKFIQTIILMSVCVLAIAFLTVVASGVVKRNFGFSDLSGVTYFLACLGLVRYAGNYKQ